MTRRDAASIFATHRSTTLFKDFSSCSEVDRDCLVSMGNLEIPDTKLRVPLLLPETFRVVGHQTSAGGNGHAKAREDSACVRFTLKTAAIAAVLLSGNAGWCCCRSRACGGVVADAGHSSSLALSLPSKLMTLTATALTPIRPSASTG